MRMADETVSILELKAVYSQNQIEEKIEAQSKMGLETYFWCLTYLGLRAISATTLMDCLRDDDVAPLSCTDVKCDWHWLPAARLQHRVWTFLLCKQRHTLITKHSTSAPFILYCRFYYLRTQR